MPSVYDGSDPNAVVTCFNELEIGAVVGLQTSTLVVAAVGAIFGTITRETVVLASLPVWCL